MKEGCGRCLNREEIKCIAMCTMLLSHAAVVFLKAPAWLYTCCVDLGYFTMLALCYFLVEGYRHTGSVKAYGGRLLVFAVLAEVPFRLAFPGREVLGMHELNAMWTIFLCFLLILVMDRQRNEAYRVCMVLGIIFASSVCDWGVLAPLFTLFFMRAGGRWERERKAFLLSVGLFGAHGFLDRLGRTAPAENLLQTGMSMAGMGLAAVCILYFYNGKRAQRGRTFFKWFFYLFYPAHLLVLGILRLAGEM